MKRQAKPLTSVLQKHSNTSLFPFGSREVQQRPAVGVADLGRVSLLQHPPDGVHVPCCHRSLDLELLMKLRVPSAVMVQHPVTCHRATVLPGAGELLTHLVTMPSWNLSMLYHSEPCVWCIQCIDLSKVPCSISAAGKDLNFHILSVLR